MAVEGNGQGFRLLVVDDEPRMCQSLTRLLGDRGYTVQAATGGREALRRLAAQAFDLVLLDLMLPDLSGQEVLDHIRREYPGLLVIMISGMASIDAAVAALRAGAYDFIRKPLESEELLRRVQNALEQKRLAKEKAAINWELEQSQKRYRYLVESSPDLIYTLDEEGRFTFVNDAFERVLGYSREQVLGRHYSEIVFPVDIERSRYTFNERRTGGRATSGLELRLRHGPEPGNTSPVEPAASADPLPVELRAQGIYDRDPLEKERHFLGTYGVARDLRERKMLEAHLQQEEKMEAIGRLAGGIAHDFNNFLAAIVGNIALAKLHARGGEEVYTRLEQMEKASLRARDLTQQLITFAQGGAPVKMAGSLPEFIREAASFVLRGSKVQPKFLFPDDLWAVEFDPGQITQVVQNLVINADQAMPEGGVVTLFGENVTTTEAYRLPLKPGRYLRVTVEDHGCGIPRENLSKIFDPFFTTKRNGVGFGLSTSYSIIKNHGGYLTVESVVGVGTRFCFFLPALAVRPKAGVKSKPKPEERLIRGEGRILVMDDDRFLQDVYQRLLRKLGYTPVIVAGGEEALEAYRQARDGGEPFAAVIMDLTIPGGLGGKETVRRLLAMDPEAVAIISSGYSNDPVMAHYPDYGFKDVVGKPFTPQRLSEVLRKALVSGRPAQE
jgi:two-component system cell cycle sensor histidine kinase/response regulator CckA